MTQPHALLRLTLATQDQARAVEAALRADDDAFAATRRQGLVVEVELRGDSIRSLLRSADDALACAGVAEDAAAAARRPRAGSQRT